MPALMHLRGQKAILAGRPWGSCNVRCRTNGPPGATREIGSPSDFKMKLFRPFPLLLLAGLLAGCGAGHPKISSIVVSPASANAVISSQATVAFTATANFDNHTSRQLTVADGLTWKSSNTAAASINNDGTATCVATGTTTITASAPSQLVVMVGQQVSTNSPMVSGMAMLNCM